MLAHQVIYVSTSALLQQVNTLDTTGCERVSHKNRPDIELTETLFEP